MSTDRFLRLPAVEQITGMSRAWIYALASAGAFPRPIKIGARASAWLESEVKEWMEARVRVSRQSIGSQP